MTYEAAVRIARGIIADRGRLAAIAFLRRLGLTFPTARTMATEIQNNAPWYRRIR